MSSDSSSNSPMLWEVTRTVLPASRAAAIRALRMPLDTGSSPADGSSRMSSSGAKRKATTAFTFCRLPPERLRRGLASSPCRSKASMSSRSLGPSSRRSSSMASSSAPVRFSGKGASWGMYPMWER